MNADGTSPVNITNANGDDVTPAWSPDGSQLVFASNRQLQFNVYRMNANGTSQTRLTSDIRPDSIACRRRPDRRSRSRAPSSRPLAPAAGHDDIRDGAERQRADAHHRYPGQRPPAPLARREQDRVRAAVRVRTERPVHRGADRGRGDEDRRHPGRRHEARLAANALGHPLGDDIACRGVRRGMPGCGAHLEERLLLERVQLHRRQRRNGRRARHVVQQCDLAEPVPAADACSRARRRRAPRARPRRSRSSGRPRRPASRSPCPPRRTAARGCAPDPRAPAVAAPRTAAASAAARSRRPARRPMRRACRAAFRPPPRATAEATPVPRITARAPPRWTRRGASTDPSASPAIISASSTPNTRASTSGGAVRWSSVLPATSNSACAAPATASRNSAPAAVVHTAMTTNDAAQTASETTIAGISLARPTSDAVTPMPSAPPAPNAALR